MDDLTEVYPDEDDNFSVYCRRLFLRYNGKFDKAGIVRLLIRIFSNQFIVDGLYSYSQSYPKDIRCEHNFGRPDRITTDVLIDFGRYWQSTNYMELDFNGYHPKWIVIDDIDVYDGLTYLMIDNSNEVLSHNNTTSHAEPFEFDSQVFKWSQLVLPMIDKPPCSVDSEDNMINWFYSLYDRFVEDRPMGKSLLGLWLYQEYPNWLYFRVSDYSIGYLTKTVIDNMNMIDWNNKDKEARGIFFDVGHPEDHTLLHKLLNDLIHRRISCQITSQDKLLTRHTNIVVVSSYPPELINEDLKILPCYKKYKIIEIRDRDKIHHINNKKLIEYQRDLISHPEKYNDNHYRYSRPGIDIYNGDIIEV